MNHVIEPPFKEILNQDFRLKGKWSEEFGNNNPIVLELACGKGEYSVGMGEIYPDKNLFSETQLYRNNKPRLRNFIST